MCDTCASHGSDRAETRPSTLAPIRRIVVVGKGGVGKSTFAALLVRILARRGSRVLAIDADEQQNLGATLGMAPDSLRGAVPIARDADYIEEKTGARPGGGSGAMLRLNPDTSDLVERHRVIGPDGVQLIVMGGVSGAGAGCLCPEHALLSAALANMRVHDEDVIVMDTHAGVEHFGRALARGFDSAIVMVEPSFNAVEVGLASARLARQLGIEVVHLGINRVRAAADIARVLDTVDELGGFDFSSVAVLPFDDAVCTFEASITGLFRVGESPLADAVEAWLASEALAVGLLGAGAR